MKIVNKNELNWVTPNQVKDGQICIVRHFAGFQEKVGKIMQRYDDKFIVLGAHRGEAHSNLFKVNDSSVLVEVLTEGTLLEI
jgi:hypothetical protein